ncbi:DMT family transporter [Melaminivora sp.]|uniref:DMT family transporter n=1 Tax=Melaminivora sp. TaxID=1933032 RepID=UPI003917EED2
MVLLAAMLWGTTGTAQSLAPAALSPYWVGALRLAVASAFFAVLAAPALRAGGARQLPWRPALLAAACVAAYNLSFFAGVKASGVALGTALAIGSGPLWAGLLQSVVQRRLPAPLWWLGTGLGVAGGAAMALSGGQGTPGAPPAGIALCLLAGLSYAGYALVNQRLVARSGAALANLAAFGGAALLSLPVAAALGGPAAAGAGTWVVVGYLGLVATGLAYLLFSTALRHLSGATAVTLALAEPVTAFVLAIVVVGEQPAALAFAGLGGVLAGLGIVIAAELRAAPGR